MERDEILVQIRAYLVELFDAAPEAVTLDADLVESLDLDSIDAVDLIVKLQELTGRKLNADEFKNIRTVNDIVERIYLLTHV